MAGGDTETRAFAERERESRPAKHTRFIDLLHRLSLYSTCLLFVCFVYFPAPGLPLPAVTRIGQIFSILSRLLTSTRFTQCSLTYPLVPKGYPLLNSIVISSVNSTSILSSRMPDQCLLFLRWLPLQTSICFCLLQSARLVSGRRFRVLGSKFSTVQQFALFS